MQDKTIPQMFFEAVAKRGDAVSIVDEFSGKKWSYEELGEAVSQVGRAILEMGLAKDDRVSIWAPNMVEWVVIALGVQSAGGVLVPLNTRFKGREAGFILKKGKVKFLFSIDEFSGNNYVDLFLKTSGGSIKNKEDHLTDEFKDLEKIIVLSRSSKEIETGEVITSWEDFLKLGITNQQTLDTRIKDSSPNDLSDILFTSGTTGLPKGVMTTHSQSLRGYSSWAKCVGLQPSDRYLIVNPFFHSFGYKSGWLASIMTGATIYPRAVFDVGEVLSFIEEHKITFLPGPPTLFHSILKHPELNSYNLSSLRVAVTGAATIPVDLIVDMYEKLQFEDVFTGYGLTESSGIATMCVKGDDTEIIATTSGRAIPGVEVIVSNDQGEEVARGEKGEVLIKGYNVMQGYLDDPESTKEAINKKGWLHTGDIGVMNEDGYLDIIDRKKDMFIMGGFNAYPADIENLMLVNKDISQVAVVGVDDEKFGEVGIAFVVLKTKNTNLKEDELLKWCKENMANYKVPRQIEFVDSLPLNPSGKVLKYELKQKFS